MHLGEISAMVARRSHAVLLLDRAGRHTTADLTVPKNVTLIFLPSRSPELNPAEQIWQYLRSNWLSNRVFETHAEPKAREATSSTPPATPRAGSSTFRRSSLLSECAIGHFRSEMRAVGMRPYVRRTEAVRGPSGSPSCGGYRLGRPGRLSQGGAGRAASARGTYGLARQVGAKT